jgi:hypothetical protein
LVTTDEKRVEVTCLSCGQLTIGARQERRHRLGDTTSFRCRLCRFPGRSLAVDDDARLWWLRQFSDEEIATMAAAVFGATADLKRVARERARLLGAWAGGNGVETPGRKQAETAP